MFDHSVIHDIKMLKGCPVCKQFCGVIGSDYPWSKACCEAYNKENT